MRRSDLIEKFDGLTAGGNGIEAAEIAARLDNLQQIRSIDTFLTLFCK